VGLLDSLLQVFAWGIIIIPIAILVAGLALFYYKPRYRKTVGIILISLGSLGLAVYSFTFYFSIVASDTSTLAIGVTSTILLVEISTLIVGIFSMVKKPRPL
jgi:hypothetical protein